MPIKIGVLTKHLFKEAKGLFKNFIGIDITLSHEPGPEGKPEALSEVLWPDSFITQVKIDGVLEKDFWIIFEKKGAILLSSKMLMLPEKTAEDFLKTGQLNDSMIDAQKEICNMLIGVIDDIFRKKVNEKWHLSQGESFFYEGDPNFLPDQEYKSFVGTAKAENDFEFKIAFILSQPLVEAIEGKEKKEEEVNATQEEPSPELMPQEEPIPEPEPNILEGLILKDTQGLKAEDIAERDFPAIYPEASLAEALEKMKAEHKDYLFVVDGLKLLGMITIAEVKGGLSPFLEEPFREYCRPQDEATKRFKVSWFMETNVPSVAPESTLVEVAKIATKGVKYSIPVCYHGRVIGEITLAKLIAVLAKLAFTDQTSMEKPISEQEIAQASKLN